MNEGNQVIEFVYYITPDGIHYPVFGGKRALMGLTGFGMPPIRYIKDRGPYQHGSTVREYRVDERLIEISQIERGCRREDFWTNSGQLNDMVRPNRGGAGRLLVILPDYTEREIFVRILEGPKINYDALSEYRPEDMLETLRFEASDPIWRDPTRQTEVFSIAPVPSCLPICLPFCIGNGIVNSTVNITYPGTWLSYPTIYITGPMNTPHISNLITNETIELNYVLKIGELVTIDLSQEKSTVTNNFGENLIGTVVNKTDLSTFHIEADPLAPGGVNPILVTGSDGVAGQTSVLISYYENYLGVPR